MASLIFSYELHRGDWGDNIRESRLHIHPAKLSSASQRSVPVAQLERLSSHSGCDHVVGDGYVPSPLSPPPGPEKDSV
ncbi:hypothetical protein THAOC_02420 [Thalassiosira oceanica]|uniref:Uncharacterized protein n=1 Tax=Thalassiosira oceanica TaxID=159749 RepID=K0TEL7_THAOC|nr:hypothetical protein THAOC_02420 [Thalassiosira oceanica]|eukprot:EJK75840.1 hypothetical protein THAOC_02420 [Thalassiosira oceanica]